MPVTAADVDGPDAAHEGGRDPDLEELSLLALANVVLRRRRLVVGTMALLLAGVTVATLMGPRTYSAEATFMPQGRSAPSNVSGLAAQFGISLAGGEPGQTPQFYVDLLTSRQILGDLVAMPFTYPTDSGTVTTTLVDLYSKPGDSAPVRRVAAIDALRRRIETDVAPTSVVTVTAAMPNAVLARDVTTRLIELVNRFNLERRQSQAAAERRFAERRLAEVAVDLRTAENRVQRFLEANRTYAASPALVFEFERLERDVALQQQLFTTLAQAQEQARVDEVRDTPVITVIEPPELPARPDARGTIKKALLALVIGALLGAMLAFVRDFFARSSGSASEDLVEFNSLRREIIEGLKHPLRGGGQRRAAAGGN